MRRLARGGVLRFEQEETMPQFLFDEYRFSQSPRIDSLTTRQVIRHATALLYRRIRDGATIASHLGAFMAFRRSLADQASRDILDDIVRYRCLGPEFSTLAKNEAMHRQMQAAMVPGYESKELGATMLGQPVRSWRVEFMGREVWVPTIRAGLFFFLHSDQYYFARGGVRIQPEAGDTVIDCGCLMGDTSLKFASTMGRGQIHAFDASPTHIRLARENLTLNPDLAGCISFYAMAIGSRNHDGTSAESPVDPSRRVNDSDPQITIDTFAERLKVDFIKMDIEGYEPAALAGALGTIRRDRPKLAISVYHGLTQLWSIGNFLRENLEGYEYFLNHHTLYAEETVLYCRPR